MSEDEIKQKKYVGMMEYFMKNVRQRDMLQVWEDFLRNFKAEIMLDKEKGYVYIKSFLWYTDSKVPGSQKQELENITIDHLSKEGQEIMRTIADSYLEEGIQLGEARGKIEIAKRMLKENLGLSLIESLQV